METKKTQYLYELIGRINEKKTRKPSEKAKQEAQAKGSLNGQRPVARNRTDYDWRLDIAQQFLDLC